MAVRTVYYVSPRSTSSGSTALLDRRSYPPDELSDSSAAEATHTYYHEAEPRSLRSPVSTDHSQLMAEKEDSPFLPIIALSPVTPSKIVCQVRGGHVFAILDSQLPGYCVFVQCLALRIPISGSAITALAHMPLRLMPESVTDPQS
ncbi:hypothetical protein E6O75_ATG08902 [Venturia nashicola]|uniref:Uncharacterized protein n=1 Tax=Venturia nashicola TaxID=86259 RepID=A0A4Z1NUV1_9PEZI|nr:hypothetical protein E6O75_ATG08902 [Venturia nashicola]